MVGWCSMGAFNDPCHLMMNQSSFSQTSIPWHLAIQDIQGAASLPSLIHGGKTSLKEPSFSGEKITINLAIFMGMSSNQKKYITLKLKTWKTWGNTQSRTSCQTHLLASFLGVTEQGVERANNMAFLHGENMDSALVQARSRVRGKWSTQTSRVQSVQ